MKALSNCNHVSKNYHDARDVTHLFEGLGRQVNTLANQILGLQGHLLVARLGRIETHTARERAGTSLARRGTRTGTRVVLLRTRGRAAGAGSALAAAGAVRRAIRVHSGHTLEGGVAGTALVRRHLDQNTGRACCAVCVLVSKGSPH